MEEELSNGEKFTCDAEKMDKSSTAIRYQFLYGEEDELIKLITNLNPHISLKKRYIRTLHDLFFLASKYIEKNGTLVIAQKFCESFYYRHYYLLLYYFLIVRMSLEEILKDDNFDTIEEIYEDNEPVRKLSEVKFECEVINGKNYHYPSVSWDTIQYYAFMDAYAEYLKWEEMPSTKKSTKCYQEIELIEEKLNIYAVETKNNDGVYQLKILVSKGSKVRSERSRKRFYGTIKSSKKKDYSEEFYLIERYYDRISQNKKCTINEYLSEEGITKTYFFKLKKEYFNQIHLKKYFQAYKFISSKQYDGDFNKVKEDYKISKRKLDIFINQYFPKFNMD